MKKIIKTTEYEYNKNGNIIKVTETTTEEDVYLPFNPVKPNIQDVSPTIPNPFKPYVGDVWNQPDSGGKTYINTGGEPLRVTYDGQV